MIYEELTRRLLAACFEVSNELGCGFLESVYEKALLVALHDVGVNAESQVPLNVFYRGQNVGEFYAHVMVEGKVIVELKAVKALVPEHLAQVMNYLKASGLSVGFLVKFGNPRLEYRRFGNHLS